MLGERYRYQGVDGRGKISPSLSQGRFSSEGESRLGVPSHDAMSSTSSRDRSRHHTRSASSLSFRAKDGSVVSSLSNENRFSSEVDSRSSRSSKLRENKRVREVDILWYLDTLPKSTLQDSEDGSCVISEAPSVWGKISSTDDSKLSGDYANDWRVARWLPKLGPAAQRYVLERQERGERSMYLDSMQEGFSHFRKMNERNVEAVKKWQFGIRTPVSEGQAASGGVSPYLSNVGGVSRSESFKNLQRLRDGEVWDGTYGIPYEGQSSVGDSRSVSRVPSGTGLDMLGIFLQAEASGSREHDDGDRGLEVIVEGEVPSGEPSWMREEARARIIAEFNQGEENYFRRVSSSNNTVPDTSEDMSLVMERLTLGPTNPIPPSRDWRQRDF